MLQTIPVPEGLQTKVFVLSEGAVNSLPELLASAFPGKRPWIIADTNTMEVAGVKAMELLAAAGLNPYEPHVFPGKPKLHPDYEYSRLLAEKMPADCVPVSVGSGVINDLTKCASGMRNIPYCCVPTACSVDGYTSAGASMSVAGTKKTVQCPAPAAVCADVSILMTAPPEMFASGYADLLTKLPAGADWYLADSVGEEPIRQDVWALIQGALRGWVADKSNLLNVFHGLAATGYSMQMYLESRPASGAEHLFSHVWEMENLSYNGEDVSHGFKVGIGLLGSMRLMEYVLNHTAGEMRAKMTPPLTREQRIQEIDELLKKGCYGTGPKETALKKYFEPEVLLKRREMLLEKLPEIQERFRKQLIPLPEITKMLEDAGCPVIPSQIGLDKEQYLHGIRTAQLIRIRYTIIDYLYELGLLEDALAVLPFA